MSDQSADRTGPEWQTGVQGGAGSRAQASTTPFLLALFFVSLIMPLQFFVGTWKLLPSTIALLVLLQVCLLDGLCTCCWFRPRGLDKGDVDIVSKMLRHRPTRLVD